MLSLLSTLGYGVSLPGRGLLQDEIVNAKGVCDMDLDAVDKGVHLYEAHENHFPISVPLFAFRDVCLAGVL